MSPIISLIGIFLGLAVLIYLAYRGHSIIWIAPVCSLASPGASSFNTKIPKKDLLQIRSRSF